MNNPINFDKKLPYYMRLAKYEKTNSKHIICILKSKDYQTNLYHIKQLYKPIILIKC